MGFINKIKGILFEEIEDDEVSVKPEVKESRKPIAERIEPQKNIQPEKNENLVKPNNVVSSYTKEEPKKSMYEPDSFLSRSNFSFPDFDEAEFSQISRVQKPKSTTNVLEYEKKKKVEKKYDYGRYERIERTEVVEKKKFKPSPIISPVYGILNEDYKPEDIKSRTTNTTSNNLDFDSVRKKAFEPKIEKNVEPKSTYYEESVTVKLKEDEEVKKQKVKTIDELLEDTSDITININDDEEKDTLNNVLDELDELNDNEVMEVKEEVNGNNDDNVENDLFDLIDSMYDNREDGE